jgi:hypothetical protein
MADIAGQFPGEQSDYLWIALLTKYRAPLLTGW